MILPLDPSLAPLTGPGAPCHWCNEPIPAKSETGRRTRADAIYCGVTHRQASHRFGHQRTAAVASGRAMRFAYADPPYPGMSARYYGDHEDFAGEVDHAELLDRLIGGFPDGWALSTSSKTLRDVLALVPAEVTVRIGAWTKPMPPGAGRRARCGWEPVLFAGGRPRPDDAPTLLDWIYAAPPRAIPGQVTGTKPAEFARWVFDCLGAAPGDELADLFPGSGAIGRAWERYVDLAPATRRPSRTERVARADLRAECLGGHDVAGPVCPQCILDASRSAAATP